MRVKSLHVENVLTFGSFDLDLDGPRQVIVGPNAAGKSNLVRVIDLVQKAVDSVSGGVASPGLAQATEQVLRSFASARHHGEPPSRAAVVRLAIELTTPRERTEVFSYVQAAVLYTLIQEISAGSSEVRVRLARWVDEEMTDERLASLMSGVVVLRHAGLPHVRWEISYEFSHDGVDYLWLLADPEHSRGIVRADSPAARLSSTPRRRLTESLLGINSTMMVPSELPSPLPAFNFANMCPQPGAAVAEPTIHLGTGIVDQQFQVFRRAMEQIALPIDADQSTFPLGYALSRILTEGVIVVGEQLRGLGTGGVPPQQPGPYSWEALASPVRSRAPWQLPLRLFELKNGSPGERARFRAIQKTFTALAPGRSVDVKFRAMSVEALGATPAGAGEVAVLGARTNDDRGASAYPAAAITVVIDRLGGSGLHPNDLPIQLHGAGTWEALVIAEALADAANRFVVLDEPAVTLHPTWQRALRSAVRAASGQFLVITHSADLVPMTDLGDITSLVRVENETGQTGAHRFDASSLEGEDIARISREFGLSVDAVSLLFARGVVLVEGETELGALPGWFAACDTAIGREPGDLDLGFWSVGGDTNFRIYVTVLHALAIPWVIVCDGAAFDIERRVARNKHIFGQVINAGVTAPAIDSFLTDLDSDRRNRVMDQDVFAEERSLGAQHGIFTLAVGWKTANKAADTPNDESFEAFVNAAMPGVLDKAKAEVGDSKVRQGRWLASTTKCPHEVSDLYEQLVAALGQRGLADS